LQGAPKLGRMRVPVQKGGNNLLLHREAG